MTKVHFIVVAAGSGSRFGADVPKQFCLLAGRPVLMHTVDALLRAVPHAACTLVLAPDMVSFWEELCTRHGYVSPRVVTGGSTRFQSVKNAVDTIEDASVIAVHDGARPLPSAAAVQRVIEAVRPGAGVVPVVAVTDSLRRVDPDGTSHAVDRAAYRAVQTPQAFDAQMLRAAYARPYSPVFTDDASVAEAFGAPIALVDGNPENIKITNPGDLEIAVLYLS